MSADASTMQTPPGDSLRPSPSFFCMILSLCEDLASHHSIVDASGFKRCAVFVGQRDEHGFRFTDMHAEVLVTHGHAAPFVRSASHCSTSSRGTSWWSRYSCRCAGVFLIVPKLPPMTRTSLASS